MIGAARYNLGKHGWAVLGDAGVVVIEVMRGEVDAGAEVCSRNWDTMLE